MSKSEILYVKGMNLSESDDDEAEEDIWDDRKLNDAYDKALKIANAEVAKRVAMSTNNQSKKKEGQSSNKKEKPDKPNKGNSSKSGKKDPNTQWKTGTPCRAVYEGDGLEYEAFVLRIINDKECVVRFLGYENSEIVPINTLKPTQGTEERTRQIEQALDDKAEEVYASQSPNIEKMDLSDIASNCASSHTDRSHHKKKKSAKKRNSKLNGSFELPEMPFPMPEMPFPMPHVSALRNLGSMEMPLPPPPPLPMSTRCDSEDQAVSTMLLSWYMSGYYTGLYQGLKRSKEGRKNM